MEQSIRVLIMYYRGRSALLLAIALEQAIWLVQVFACAHYASLLVFTSCTQADKVVNTSLAFREAGGESFAKGTDNRSSDSAAGGNQSRGEGDQRLGYGWSCNGGKNGSGNSQE
ncbi:hypothetical protein B0O80DRAFT_434394 [Mortierella sp. GBAus27b]|nr:hypothetical protein B0O80DRAFT_434394 [Mortierella sp. GBAus27b]